MELKHAIWIKQFNRTDWKKKIDEVQRDEKYERKIRAISEN